ncbi:MAG TPA: ferrochelatase [Caulobacteraceae bacterium]|nr:ferrochelatase [Caulobacteraceae bacterium]
MSQRRIAVVLLNLGGPDSLKAVRPFLFNLFKDPAIMPLPAPARLAVAALITARRSKLATGNYAYMGGSSPLLKETEAQAEALSATLAGRLKDAETRTFIAMRYWRPFTDDIARQVEAFGPDEVVLLPLYPQFSSATTGSSLKAWRLAYRGPVSAHEVCCWFELDGFVAAHVARIRACWEAAGRPDKVRVLFSAHGLPERDIDKGDPYRWQVEQTCAAIAAKLQWPWDHRVCYQSRVGPLKWIGPSTPEAIAEACVDGMNVLIDPVAFVSEHVETLVELDRDYAELADANGCDVYLRARTVGTEPVFIEALADVVVRALDREPGVRPDGRACEAGWRGCPLQGSAA